MKLLEVADFGRQLVETGDLDPVYIALYRAELEPLKLRRWLLAYWCFYHMGSASWIVGQPNYWKAMELAAAGPVHPRGTERRHFRGSASIKSVAYLKSRDVAGLFQPFDDHGADGKTMTLKEVMDYVKEWVGFGDWIAFKVADMLERLGMVRIDFRDTDTFLFKSPREGAELVVERYGPKKGVADKPKWALDYLSKRLGSLLAPPGYERRLNGQEYETILCKWCSHSKGRYYVGHDLKEVEEALGRYPKSRMAQLLRRSLREAPKENPRLLTVG